MEDMQTAESQTSGAAAKHERGDKFPNLSAHEGHHQNSSNYSE